MTNNSQWSQINIRTGLLNIVREIVSDMPDIGSVAHYIDIAIRLKVENDKADKKARRYLVQKDQPKEEAAQVVRPSANQGKE